MAKTTSLFSVHATEACPQCGADMVMKNGQYGVFLGCSAYPTCEFIRPLQQQLEGHIIKPLEGQYCPTCQSTLVLRQGRYGMFICCGDYPICGYTAETNKTEETAVKCPQCSTGRLQPRNSRSGKLFYACDQYPRCQFSVSSLPIQEMCEHCHYPLLIEKKTAQGRSRFCANKRCGKPALMRGEV